MIAFAEPFEAAGAELAAAGADPEVAPVGAALDAAVVFAAVCAEPADPLFEEHPLSSQIARTDAAANAVI